MADIALDIQLGVESQDKAIELSVNKRRKYIAMSIQKSTTPIEEYEGPYTAVSQLYYGTTLETSGKRMADNVTIEPIPIHEVSNPKGGVTVTIGSL